LLSAFTATILIFGLLTRPSQAEILHSTISTPSTTASCLLNIGVCPAVTDPNPIPPPDPTPVDPNAPPSTDTTAPVASLTDPSPMLAGGTVLSAQTVSIAGLVSDDNLASFVLALNGTVLQQGSAMTDKMVAINTTWNVSTPNVVPSGIYTVTLDATDVALHKTHDEKTIVVDNDGPTVAVTGGDTIIKSGSISPTTVADDPRGIATYAWTQAASDLTQLTFDPTVSEPTFTPTVEGSYTFSVDVADGLGNVTTKTFAFGYAKALETVPLPTAQDPTEGLVDQSPSTVVVPPTAVSPTARSAQDVIPAGNDTGVLGATVDTSDKATATAAAVATIAPTSAGWSIFGLLWYWWLAIIAVVISAWVFVKRRVASVVV
jgi:hypothetical protein